METLKYKIGFLIACLFIGFVIYINSGTPKEDIDPKELALSNIDKIEIIRYVDEKKIFLADSESIKPIINQLLKSTKVEIYNPKTSTSTFFLKIQLKNNQVLKFGLEKNHSQGNYFWGQNFKFKNDSFFTEIEKIDFK